MKKQFLLAVLCSLYTALLLSTHAADTPPEGVTLDDLTDPNTGTITHSNCHQTYYGANLFDNDSTTSAGRWLCPGTSGWVCYTFPSPTTVNSYRLFNAGPTGYSQTTRAPKAWAFEGSLDGETWITLDARSNETAWGIGEIRYYAFENLIPYTHYRLNVSAINSGSDYVQLHEMELYNTNPPGCTLTVVGDPHFYGTPSPAYGTHTLDSTSVQLSIPLLSTNRIQSTEYTCIGWELISQKNGISSGASNEYTLPVELDDAYIFRWKFSSRRIREVNSVYVAVDGDDANLGISPDAPFATVQTAIDIVREEPDPIIYILPGTYRNHGKHILDRGISVIGLGETPNDVVFTNTVSGYGKNATFFTLRHPKALVANMTLAGGSAHQTTTPGAIYIQEDGGTLSNCVLRANTIYHPFDRAGAIWLSSDAGRVTRCTFLNNAIKRSVSSWQTSYQGGTALFMTKGTVDNCLFRDNFLVTPETNFWSTATIVMQGGTLENCTLINNEASNSAGILVQGTAASTVRNVAFFGNAIPEDCRIPENPLDHHLIVTSTQAAISHCAFQGNDSLGENPITGLTKAAFVNFDQGNYIPSPFGALYDAGPTITSYSLDLHGFPRTIGSHIDIGCFEAINAGTLLLLR